MSNNLFNLSLDSEPQPRVWLTLMTAAGNEENLRELVEPLLPHIDGVVAVFHRPCDGDAGLAYLESVKGAGKVIVRDWVQRHNYSQTETLYAGVIQEGDLFIITDTLERPAAQFIQHCKGHLNQFMLEHDVDCLYYYGKAYIVRYNESMHYQGSPHWWLVGVKSGIELSGFEAYKDEGKVRLNVRPFKRQDENNWVGHYLKYFLYPPGSNHALLGLDTYGDPAQLFPLREEKRLLFRQEMRRRGYPVTVDGFKAMCKAEGQPDESLKTFLNSDKVWADAYWGLVMGKPEILTHSHKPADMVPVL